MLDQEDYLYRRVGGSLQAEYPAGHHYHQSRQQRILIHVVGSLSIMLAAAVGLFCLFHWGSGGREDYNGSNAIQFLADANVPLPEDWLLNLPHFEYRLNSLNVCSQGDHDDPPYFLALIHSKPQHFRQRQVIRSTWASRRPKDPLIRPVFTLGLVQPEDSSTLDVQSLVDAEWTKYGDIVQGQFVDHYHNLTLKNLMGLKWAVRHCPSAKFILKADDDAFIDVAQLKGFIRRTFNHDEDRLLESDTLICNVQENGTVQRTGKWAVTTREYAGATYPPFCSGLAYVLRPSLANKLLAASRAGLVRPALWIDDVYVTGLLARAVRARHFYLNLRYTTDETALKDWVDGPMPYIVTELDTTRPDWRQTAEKLWNKTLELH